MGHQRQRGAVLVVSLLLLTVMTLLVLSAINTGTTNMRILENTRVKQEAHEIAQLAIDEFVSEPTNFDPPNTTKTEITKGDYTVEITAPTCVAARPAWGDTEVEGGGSGSATGKEDTTWTFEATVTAADGATAEIEQGVWIRKLVGVCP